MAVRGKLLLLAAAIGSLLVIPAAAGFGAQEANDPFATATVVSNSAGTVQASAMFDGSVQDPDAVTFFPNAGSGRESEVIFGTTLVTLDGIRVHAANDGPGFGFRRAMSRFQFFADQDEDGILATTERLIDQPVDIRYPGPRAAGAGPGIPIVLSFEFPAPVTARRWKVVVTQGTDVGRFDGVRIGEVDAVPSPPRATTLTVAPAVSGLFSLSARLTETGTGGPVADRIVTMATSAGATCSAPTDANGVATCSGVGALAQILVELGFTASFPGDGRFLASSARAGLLVGGVGSSPPVAVPVAPTTVGLPVAGPVGRATSPTTSPTASSSSTTRPGPVVTYTPTPTGELRGAPSPSASDGSSSPRPGPADSGGRVTGHRSAFVESVLGPSELSLSPVLVAENLAIAAGLVLLIAFPADLFNATALANYDQIARWKVFAWSATVRKMVGRMPDAAKVPAFATAGAVLYAQLSPDFGFDRRSLALVVGMLCSLVLLALVHDVTRAFYVRRFDIPSAVGTQPLLLLFAVVLVVLSRVADLAPGYVYGLFTAVIYLRPVDVRLDGKALALSSVVLGILAGAAWLMWDPVRELASRPDAGFPSVVLDAFLASFWVSALGTVVFGLVPLRFLSGEAVRRWSTTGWLAIYGLALMFFLHTMAHPERGFYSRADVPLPVVLVPFFGFALFSVAFWGYFRARGQPQPAGPSVIPGINAG